MKFFRVGFIKNVLIHFLTKYLTQFLENVVLDGIYWESWYGPTSSTTNIVNIPPDERMFFFQSKMIGLPILRQLRVRDDSCENHESIALTLKECWAQFSTRYFYLELIKNKIFYFYKSS